MKSHAVVECLESRIAPAAVLTFTDVDGDTVLIKTSLGSNADLAPLIKTEALGMGVAIREIDLSAASAIFEGTDLSVQVVAKGETGDGLVNVRYIDAAGLDDGSDMDLGHVSIEGDIGKILGGRFGGLSMASLNAKTFGVADAAMYEFSALQSYFKGNLGEVTVTGLMHNVFLTFSGAESMKIGGMLGATVNGAGVVDKIKVGDMNFSTLRASSFGKLTVQNMIVSNVIDAAATIGVLNILGTTNALVEIDAAAVDKFTAKQGFAGIALIGSVNKMSVTGDFTGLLGTNTLGTLNVTGDMIGSTVETGSVSVDGNAGRIQVKGDVIGGLAEETGFLQIGGNIESIRIGGSLRAFGILNAIIPVTELDDSGSIQVGGSLGSLFIGKDVLGTSVHTAGHQSDSTGSIIVQGNLNKAVIGGSLVGGSDLTNSLQASGTIQVGKDIGSLLIKGDVIGGAANEAVISAMGFASNELAIGKLTILGDMKDASIRAGDATSELIVQGDSRDESVGSLKVGGDFVRSRVFVGQKGMFDNPDVIARISKIVIGGTATGGDASKSYGILAQEVGSLRVNGKSYALTPGPLNDLKIDLDPEGNTILAEKQS